jgi:tRNA-dihydrouridine synthase A
MRQITRHSLLYSEMVVAQAIHHCDKPGQQDRLERLLGFDSVEKPLALQLGGDDPGLLAEPARVADCVAAMAAASGLPVSVKHRIGIDTRDSYAELLDFVDTVAAAGASRFSVHARKAWLEGLDPKQNRSVPPLRYELVHQLKRDRPQLQIELNGGLEDLAALRGSGLVDGVIVGKALYAGKFTLAEALGQLRSQPLHGAADQLCAFLEASLGPSRRGPIPGAR